jgi:hypothetical protein
MRYWATPKSVSPASWKKGTSIAFRLLILPGTVAFWPLLAVRWAKASSRRRNP